MKILFETFKKSIYNPEFYRTVSEAPLDGALRYYFRITFVLAVFSTVIFGIFLIPHGVYFVNKVAPSLVSEYYPKELIIKIKKGEVSTNVPEPYFIGGKDRPDSMLKDNDLENMLVIDTTKDFNKKTFEEYKTFALLTKNEIVTQDTNGRITIQSLQGAPSMTVNQAMLFDWAEKMRTLLVYIVPLGVLITFFIIFLGYVAYLIPLFLFALIPFFLSRIKKTPLGYGGAYRMSMYAVLPGLVLKTLLNASGFFFVPAYLSLLVFMLVISLNMRETVQPTLFSGDKK